MLAEFIFDSPDIHVGVYKIRIIRALAPNDWHFWLKPSLVRELNLPRLKSRGYSNKKCIFE